MGFSIKKLRRKFVKVASGAAGGFLASGFNPIGAIAGGAAGLVSGGKGKVLKNVMMGAAVGAPAGTIATKLGYTGPLTTPMFGDKYALLTRAVDYAGSTGKVVRALGTGASILDKTRAAESAMPQSLPPPGDSSNPTFYSDMVRNATAPLASLVDGTERTPYTPASKGGDSLLPALALGGVALLLASA